MLEVCVKGNYYAKFHTHSYHCYREIQFISKTQVTRRKTLTSVELEMQVKGTGAWLMSVPRTITMQCFILQAINAPFLDSK